jgi:hypothetical protein
MEATGHSHCIERTKNSGCLSIPTKELSYDFVGVSLEDWIGGLLRASKT